jgi:hypothetical protein
MKRVAAYLAVFITGCWEPIPHLRIPDSIADRPAIGRPFDDSTTGTVSGTVRWAGECPTIPQLRVMVWTNTGARWASVPNPNAPRFTNDGSVVGAVVFLRGVDPATAAPMHFPPLAVEANDNEISVIPGGRVGFVPLGSTVDFRSTSDTILGVRGRHDAYFTLMLPDRGTARRRFDRPGRVELTSPANVYWAIADLFVCEHPYYTRTDDHGNFRFESVPPGKYEVVCRVPGWTMTHTERDPETGAVFRAEYSHAIEVALPLRLGVKGNAEIPVSVPAATR